MLTLASICTDDKIMTIIKLIKMFLQLVQIVIPIALIVLGSIDIGKAVVSLDDGAAKKGQKKFINRCIAAVLVFLSATIFRAAMGFVGNDAWQKCWDAIDTTPVKNIACNYKASSGTIKITFKNDKVTYSTDLCKESAGLVASNFVNGCPSKLYYKGDNAGSTTGFKCTFSASALRGYNMITLSE